MKQRETKSSIAYNYLKKAIIDGSMRPMELISEEKIQEELNISRTPVREAILRLKSECFISILPNKATLVAPLSLDLIKYLYTMRKLNEPYICYQASIYLSKAKIAELYKEVQNNIFDNKVEAIGSYIEKDNTLHWTLLNACQNPFLIRAMANIYDHIDRTRKLVMDPNIEDHQKEHIAILEAMQKGDQEEIKQIALQHVLTSEKRALTLLLDR